MGANVSSASCGVGTLNAHHSVADVPSNRLLISNLSTGSSSNDCNNISSSSGNVVSSSQTPSTPVSRLCKKKSLSFASTLRRHFTRKVRPSCKNSKHSRVFRDFLSRWPTAGLLQLVSQYESANLLRDLHIQAELARPSPPSVAQNLLQLLKNSNCADTHIEYGGKTFAIHKALICARCPLFREMLGKVYQFGAQVPIQLNMPELSAELFEQLLQYLYTGKLKEMSPQAQLSGSLTPDMLQKLNQHVPNDLDRDLRHLLDTGLYSDATLVFTNGSFVSSIKNSGGDSSTALESSNVSKSPRSADNSLEERLNTIDLNSIDDINSEQVVLCKACDIQTEYSCHMSILAARSRFFCNAITRELDRLLKPGTRNASFQSLDTAKRKVRVALDENFVPRRFARIVLHSLYRDTDILQLLPACVCKCSQLQKRQLDYRGREYNTISSSVTSCLSMPIQTNGFTEGSSLLSGFSVGSCNQSNNVKLTPAKFLPELFQLYHLGRLLEIDSLIYNVENLIFDSISLSTSINILKWTRKGFGSQFIRRQVMQMLREEFCTIASDWQLLELEENELLELIGSEFVQASELELLQAVIRWGEHKLTKQMQETEPNLISQTAHSIRRNNRRCPLDDDQLRNLIQHLLCQIRMNHLLPQPNEFLAWLKRRGLVGNAFNEIKSKVELPELFSQSSPDSMLLNMSIQSQSNPSKLSWSLSNHIQHWIPNGKAPLNEKPRLFLVYYEEAKSYLEERVGRPGEMINTFRSSIRSHSQSHEPPSLQQLFTPKNNALESERQMPDTLYMVNRSRSNEHLGGIHHVYAPCSASLSDGRRSVASSLSSGSRFSIVQSELQNTYNIQSTALDPLVDIHLHSLTPERLTLMFQREQDLRALALSNRHLSALEDKTLLLQLIGLRVVREFGLDDFVAQVFQSTSPGSWSVANTVGVATTVVATTDSVNSSTMNHVNDFFLDEDFDRNLDEIDDAVFAMSSLNRTAIAAKKARQENLSALRSPNFD